MLLKNTVGEKLTNLVNKIIEFRKAEVLRMESQNFYIGDVTTSNITMINGGVQSNVIPSELKMMVDFSLALDIDHSEFENRLKRWCEESGEGITFVWEQHQPKVAPTKTDDSNIYWVAFKKSIDEL